MKISGTKINAQRGFGMIEIVVASAIVGLTFFALAGLAQLSFRSAVESSLKRRAYFLAEENLEVIRVLRDSGWTPNIASKGNNVRYYPVFATSTKVWGLSSTSPEIIDGMERGVRFLDVYRRNSDDDIVASTSPDVKYLDEGTREVVSYVVWGGEGEEIELRTYITNIFSN